MSTQIDTDHFRQKLLEERQRVADAIAYLHEENPGSISDETQEAGGVDNHLGDTATVTVDREIDYTLEENSEHVLSEIDAALKRLDDGTYGICTNCRKQIEPERLEFLPYATLCIDCKRRQERG
jgi:RNA polymerase-binding protein DksA